MLKKWLPNWLNGLIVDYTNDPDFRVRFQSELNRVWEEKNQTLVNLKQK